MDEYTESQRKFCVECDEEVTFEEQGDNRGMCYECNVEDEI